MDEKEIVIYENVLEYISLELSHILKNIPNKYKGIIEEIRLRYGVPINIYLNNSDYFVTSKGSLTKNKEEGRLVNKQELIETFQLVSNYSVYAFEEEIKNGFITLRGGHRVGIGGKVLYGTKGIETIRNISSLNIRIAREKIGVSEKLIKYIIDFPQTIHNTLIVSPPQCGKTTILRDLIRNLSNGSKLLGGKGLKVGVIDERSELAGMYNGMPQFQIGLRTDVLDGCNKKDGTIMLIRAMSPEIIAMDEIGSITDVDAIHEALKAGVKIIATIHGSNLEDLLSKRSLRMLIEDKIFKRYIFLDNSKGVGTIKDIIEGDTFTSII
ncbi:stage III sporulation protein AA [Clostridium sp. Cult2]|uniref:stage III sporulation protein AA n=1 Tax=Clostridium sp. Cult2 TaxID=2079003 RepID=UPI001EFFAC9A|nr:stage III sporulation protein AA [Clostridium sp. Cult2]MCF6465623.1 stage III sporulation protein AA [Clostridium sp. Cult2]